MKVAFCDRDGTITHEHDDADWPSVKSPTLRSGSIEGLKLLVENGFEIIVVTNQPLIGAGRLTIKQYEDYTKELLEILRAGGVTVRDILMCPHMKEDGCRCCKPRPGMIEDALHHYPSIDLARSVVIGDRFSDIELAKVFHLRSFCVGFDAPGATRVESILEAACILQSEQNKALLPDARGKRDD